MKGEEFKGLNWTAPNGRWYRATEDGCEVEMLVDGQWSEANGSAITAFREGVKVRTAKAALDELLSEREEWVEIATPTGAIYRFTPEGECKQSRYTHESRWQTEDWPAADCIAKAFLRVRDEAVRELKAIIAENHHFDLGRVTFQQASDIMGWFGRLTEAAKRVKL